MLASIDKYLNEKCTRITFVREAADYQRGDGYLRVPAGIRIGIASAYDDPETQPKGVKTGLYTAHEHNFS